MRNSLVRRAALFAVALDADIVVMENARELIRGNFKAHYDAFRRHLEDSGYEVSGQSLLLSRFGLPQGRERAIVIAAKKPLPLHTLESLWQGWTVRPAAVTVRAAFRAITTKATGRDACPRFTRPVVERRLRAMLRTSLGFPGQGAPRTRSGASMRACREKGKHFSGSGSASACARPNFADTVEGSSQT